MKLSVLLVQILLVGGGILLYDTLKTDGPSTPDSGAQHDLLQADDLGAEPEDDAPAIILDGGGEGILAKRNANRIESLEELIAVMRNRYSGDGGGHAGLPSAKDGALPSLDEADVVDAEDPVYDERTLASIEAYMDEINRRKLAERQKNRITSELERLGVELSDSQQESVVATTLEYQQKARDLLRQTFTRDEKGREERKQAFAGLREEFTATINRLVPTAEAEKISGSRLSRGFGFSSAGLGSTRRAERGGRNRRGGGRKGGDR